MDVTDGWPTYRLAVTGPRAWGDRRSVWARLYNMWEAFAPGRHFVVVHGDAEGVDGHAKAWAEYAHSKALQVTHEPWPAAWDTDFGAAAGPIRNRKMIDSGIDALLAFLRVCELPPDKCRIYKRHPDRQHWTHGAGQCFEYATRQNVPTFVVEWPIRHMPARRWELPPAPTPPGLFEEHWAANRDA